MGWQPTKPNPKVATATDVDDPAAGEADVTLAADELEFFPEQLRQAARLRDRCARAKRQNRNTTMISRVRRVTPRRRGAGRPGGQRRSTPAAGSGDSSESGEPEPGERAAHVARESGV